MSTFQRWWQVHSFKKPTLASPLLRSPCLSNDCYCPHLAQRVLCLGYLLRFPGLICCETGLMVILSSRSAAPQNELYRDIIRRNYRINKVVRKVRMETKSRFRGIRQHVLQVRHGLGGGKGGGKMPEALGCIMCAKC